MDPFSRQDPQDVPSEPTQPNPVNESADQSGVLDQGTVQPTVATPISPSDSAPVLTNHPPAATAAPNSHNTASDDALWQMQTTPAAPEPAPTVSATAAAVTDPGAETPDNPSAATSLTASPSTTQEAVVGGVTDLPPPDEPNTGKKKKLIAIIAVVGATLLLGGTAAAYAVINNTPEKILQDAYFNTVKQEEGGYSASVTGGKGLGKITLSGGWTKDMASADLSVDVPADEAEGTHHLGASIVTTNDKVYVKADGVKEFASGYLGSESTPYDSLIAKIDGKWLVITESDLEKYFGIEKDPQDEKRTECLETALTSFQTDKNQQREVYDVYQKNTFIILTKQKDEQIESRSAYHLSVAVDNKKAESFAKGLESTVVYKAMHKCVEQDVSDDSSGDSATEDSTEDESTDNKQPSIDLWVDKSSRTLRKVQVKSHESEPADSRVTVQVTFDFTKKVKIDEPEALVTIEDLKVEIDKIQQQFESGDVKSLGVSETNAPVQGRARDAERKTDINAIAGELEAVYAQYGYYPNLAGLNDAVTRTKMGIQIDSKEFIDPSNSKVTSFQAGVNPAPKTRGTEVQAYYYAPIYCIGSGVAQECDGYVIYAFLEDGTVYVRESVDNHMPQELGVSTQRIPLIDAVRSTLRF